jgi:hypothetical protein
LRIATFAMALAAAGCASVWRGFSTRDVGRVAVSAEPWSAEGLSGRRLTTEHFDIISTIRDTEFESALPRIMEAAHARYTATLRPTGDGSTDWTSKPARHQQAGLPVGPARLVTYIFGTRSEWSRFARRRFPARYAIYSRIRSGGFTEGAASVSFYTTRSTTLATLVHEGWHQYVAARFEAPIPAWLNEGLACYHEAIEIAGPEPRFTPQRNTFRISSLRKAIQSNTLLPLGHIVDTDAGQVISRHHGGVAHLYYAQAWAFVTFLRHGAGGRYSPAFNRMLRDIADGTFNHRVRAAGLTSATAGQSYGESVFRVYFGCTPDEMADGYYDHLVRLAGF